MKKFKALILILGLFFIFSAQSCEPDPIKVEFQNVQLAFFQSFESGVDDFMKGYDGYGELKSFMIQYKEKEV